MRIVMMGTGTFAEPTFQKLVDSGCNVVGLVTQPEKTIGKEKASTRLAGMGMAQIAFKNKIPAQSPQSINSPEGVSLLKGWNPELLVVAAYGQILSREVLEIPTLGGINVHASLLPRFRGAAPVQWAIATGDTETGVSILRMTPLLDGGDLLAVQKVPIDEYETAGELEARLAPIGASLAVEVIKKLEKGPLTGIPQDHSKVSKAPKLKKENGDIDWTKSAREVCCQIRAMHPWPTAYTHWKREGTPPLRLVVYPAKIGKASTNLTPGSVLMPAKDAQTMAIAVGNGETVDLTEVQPAGKNRMNALDFLRGRRPQEGDFLGKA